MVFSRRSAAHCHGRIEDGGCSVPGETFPKNNILTLLRSLPALCTGIGLEMAFQVWSCRSSVTTGGFSHSSRHLNASFGAKTCGAVGAVLTQVEEALSSPGCSGLRFGSRVWFGFFFYNANPRPIAVRSASAAIASPFSRCLLKDK